MRLLQIYARVIVSIVSYLTHQSPRKKKQFLISALVITIVFFFPVFYLWIDFDSAKQLKNYRPPIPSKLLDRNGKLITTFFKNNRIVVNLKDLPPHLIQSFIAIEDNNFYNHPGIDFQGIVRAALKNFFSSGIRQGGSTITQQVVKITLTNRSRTYTRKIREAFLSLYMDFIFSKDEILNLYLNEIYFGHGNYGVEAASNFYFKKSAKDLSIGESGILASLPSSPNNYSPVRNPHLSRSRVVQVLLRMIDLNFITKEEASKSFDELTNYYENLNMSPEATAFGSRIDNAPYFTEYLRGILEEMVGKTNLYEKGLIIYTSLDIDHQIAAQKALWKGLNEQTEKGFENIFTRHMEFSREYSDTVKLAQDVLGIPEFAIKRSASEYQFQLEFFDEMYSNLEILNHISGSSQSLDNYLNSIRESNPYLPHITPAQGALIEIDHKTGEITAMVGGTPFTSLNQINRTIQIKRQPGSTFKPVLYATAIDMGKITAASVFPDMPMIHPDSEGDYWIPENSTGGFRGFVTIREALINSINMVSIVIAREIGFRNAIEKIARQLHIEKKDIPVNLTVALGSFEVSPMQMARAFTLFPRGGLDLEPYSINKIIDNNQKTIYYRKAPQNEEQIISEGTAAIMTSLLKAVVDEGTGKIVRKIGYKGFAAGKTGTSSNFRDAWFVGFNDRYTSAVWVGYDKGTKGLGEGQFGGSVSAPIWANFQYYAQPYRKNDEPFIITNGVIEVEICKTTGKLPNENCTETIKELFLPGTEPTEEDSESAHQRIKGTIKTNSPDTADTKEHIDEKNLLEDIYQ
jgi:penicillin-binding protein 1A